MDKPLLSVIIPMYNGEKYIENIIKAFKNQTKKCFELIFVDDGSKDNTYQKLQEYVGKEDFDITVYHQENQGVSAARNAGVALAKGEYISFVDGDDYIVADYIELLANQYNQNDFDVCIFQSLRIKEDEPYIPQITDKTIKPIDKIAMLERMVVNPTALGMCNLFVKRSFYEEQGLSFKIGYKYYEDYDVLYRIFAVAEKIVITEYQMYFYIMREGSAMARFNTQRLSCVELLEKLMSVFEKNSPEFVKTFENWGISRIFWSMMWQASMAFSVKDALYFAKKTNMSQYMRNLYNIPGKKVSLSARLYSVSKVAFIMAAKILGKTHSKVEKVDIQPFKEYFENLPKKILVYGMTDNKGGIEAYIMNMYRNIDRQKLQFDFVVDWDTMAYSEEVIENGSKIYYIPAKSKQPIKQITDFIKILKNHKEYKTIYFNILNAGGAFNMIAPFLMRRKIVVHSHNGSDDNMKLHKIFMIPLNIVADSRLACSKLAAEYMFGKSYLEKGQVKIINNAINIDNYTFDAEKRAKKREELQLDDNFTIFHAGRMANQKNPLFLIDIFANICKRNEKAILLYAGTGPMEDEVREYAKSKGVFNNIKFLGMRNDVPELMQAADVFLLPSKYEGLPVVGIEAQAADLQCFLSDRISSAVKITEKMHFMSIDDNADLWAQAILQVETNNRKSRKSEISDAGYNISQETGKLVEELM